RGRLDLVQVVDGVVALICFGATTSTLSNATPNGGHLGPSQITLFAAALAAPLALRNKFPLTAWSVSALAMLWTGWAIPLGNGSSSPWAPAGPLVYALCLYAVAVRCKTWVV